MIRWKRAHKNVVTYPEDWKELSEAVKKRDNYTCRKCGKHRSQLPLGVFLNADHIKRLADGGTNSKSNLQTLCSTCHAKRPGHEHMRNRMRP